jgi:hypothetical protein|tara:strand:+ start:208 stop:393 length:186 start_codon:yes stop_codon:yes gene_type:complete
VANKTKTYVVTIDVIDSFNCEVEASTEAEALQKAEEIDAPQRNNVAHYTEKKVIGIDKDWV